MHIIEFIDGLQRVRRDCIAVSIRVGNYTITLFMFGIQNTKSSESRFSNNTRSYFLSRNFKVSKTCDAYFRTLTRKERSSCKFSFILDSNGVCKKIVINGRFKGNMNKGRESLGSNVASLEDCAQLGLESENDIQAVQLYVAGNNKCYGFYDKKASKLVQLQSNTVVFHMCILDDEMAEELSGNCRSTTARLQHKPSTVVVRSFSGFSNMF